MYRLLTFGVIILSVLITVVLSLKLISILKNKYPNVYSEYGEPNPLLPSPSTLNFLGEFVVGGVFKIDLNQQDYKYVTRVRFSMIFVVISIVLDMYMVFS